MVPKRTLYFCRSHNCSPKKMFAVLHRARFHSPAMDTSQQAQAHVHHLIGNETDKLIVVRIGAQSRYAVTIAADCNSGTARLTSRCHVAPMAEVNNAARLCENSMHSTPSIKMTVQMSSGCVFPDVPRGQGPVKIWCNGVFTQPPATAVVPFCRLKFWIWP